MNIITSIKNKITKDSQSKICELEEENNKLNEALAKQKHDQEHNTVYYISTDRICCDIQRNNLNDESFLRLTDSIKKYGIIEPLVVKRISVDTTIDGGLYSLISGYRRISAARLIGIDKVPAIISDKNEEIHILSYNINNTTQKYNIFEEADLAINYFNNNQGDIESVLHNLCITKEKLAEYLLVSSIPDEQREMCEHYHLTDKQIICLSKIKDHKQRRFAIRHVGSSDMSLRQTIEYLYDMHAIDCFASSDLPSKAKMILKDIRLFYNTIDRAIDTFSESGIRTECHKRENSDGFNISIQIYKSTHSAE